ncbi:MAG: B12-binding domain-containing radical SAM protein [Victivallales bacterium]|jgi:anaerobic magnesium-protoporphyrin IX monomethyl ester cyclase|nr:B12-binding domain-containing radical SAM protein [Victivallales bacterium]
MRILILDHPRPLCPEHWNDVANAPLSASLNTGYALAVAEAAGHEPAYLDLNSESAPPERMARHVLDADPECVLIHWVYTWDAGPHVTSLIRMLRAHGYRGSIGAFGVFPTFCSAEMLEDNPGLDFVLVGEFEGTLADLLGYRSLQAALDPPLPGIRSHNGFGGRRPLINDLGVVPVPWDVGRSADLSQVNVAASRGCYGACTFCSIQPFYGQSKWRRRSVQDVVAEVQLRGVSRGKDQVYFVDPNFLGPGASGQRRARELGGRLRDLPVRFGMETRVNDVHGETIAVLREGGLDSVFLGVESASDAVLQRMNKRITPAQSALAIRQLRDAGILVTTGFIMFEPDSTLADVRTNFRFVEENGLLGHPDQSANVLHHSQIILKGSPAYACLEREGRLLLSAQSPYEASCQYRHAEVEAMARTVGNVVLCYFRQFDRFWRAQGLTKLDTDETAHSLRSPGFPAEAANRVLVGSFQECLEAASQGNIGALPGIGADAVASLEALFGGEGATAERRLIT